MSTQEKSESSLLPDKKGRNLIIFILLFSVLGEFIIFPLLGDFNLIRLLLTLALVYFVYEGYNWARILMGILLGLAGIIGLIPLTIKHNFSGFWVLIVVMDVYYFVGMSILLFSKSAIAFLKHQRERSK